jgi:hypothetical protein
MENSETVKQFQATINVPHEIKIGWHDWIETKPTALNYHECCGILILFGITPPSFEELYGLLKS